MYAVVTMKVGIRLPKGATLIEACDGTGVGIKINGKEYKPLISMECEQDGTELHSDVEFAAVGMEVVDYIDSDVVFETNKEYEG